jgi:hypothetical protein
MKKVQTVLAAAVLMAAPGFALAEGGCGWMKQQTAQISCAPGTTLDETTNTCVTVTG